MMPLEELLSDMRRLRSAGAFQDVNFLVEKKKIPAHKVRITSLQELTDDLLQAIVNARCAELGKLIEDKPEVEIKSIRQGVLEQILDCASLLFFFFAVALNRHLQTSISTR
jgi:hypothetical protein